MPSSIKWTSIFRGDTGDTFIVQIFDINHNGNPTQYSLGSKPVELKWDGKGEDRFSPIFQLKIKHFFYISQFTGLI